MLCLLLITLTLSACLAVTKFDVHMCILNILVICTSINYFIDQR